MQPFQAPMGIVFVRYKWRLNLKEDQLHGILVEYSILNSIAMKVTKTRCCDEKGFAGKVAILESHMSHELRLPFFCPLHNILDMLGLVLA